ncbi:pentapeptide repeat-containing protein [Allorhizocola rhizosphaerae]|uniref:pentapeptide repeat-containing protein n=1 Tax=Allorhizocola rhizosphaerae TaxID=1872709 RepID=UPI000E3CAA97|nr:pentapeptide repeat-containing protein [Allorhizocola rhizosphaerae]
MVRFDQELRADCTRCFALCCVVPAFAASADFAIDKPGGHACPHLAGDLRCGIHHRLRDSGFTGCTVFDCFGAGQKVSQVTFGGRDWRTQPDIREQMFESFAVMRQLHELLWYLEAALALSSTTPIHAELRRAFSETSQLTLAEDVRSVDVPAHRARVNELLLRASTLARSGTRGPNHRGATLIGAQLAGVDLRGANLRGALLIGANLARADLRLADMTGADLRGAYLTGANLSTTLFVTQPQLDSAHGDGKTRLPKGLARPAHWRG